MKGKLILSVFTLFLIISPVLAENHKKKVEVEKSNITSAINLTHLGAACRAAMAVISSFIRTSGVVAKFLEQDDAVFREVQLNLEKEISRLENEIIPYREFIVRSNIMDEIFWQGVEQNVFDTASKQLINSVSESILSDTLVIFLNSLLNISGKCVVEFDKEKKKVSLQPPDRPN